MGIGVFQGNNDTGVRDWQDIFSLKAAGDTRVLH